MNFGSFKNVICKICQKAPFSIATTPRCREGSYTFPWNSSTLPLIRALYCWVLSKDVSSTIFKVFNMLQPRIVPRCPGLLVNQETWVQSKVAAYQRFLKWYLIIPCLTFSNIRYISGVKWKNPGKGVAPSPPHTHTYETICANYLLFIKNSVTSSLVKWVECLPGRPGSNPRLCHTKDFKNDTWYLLA